MTEQPHHWITLHRVRLPEVVSATQNSLQAPTGVDCWRCCPSQAIGDDGLPTWASNTWCGLALHGSEEGARAIYEAPLAHLPWLADAVEQWHALALPIAHHGSLNWRGHVEEDSAIRVTSEKAPGRMVVITTAGYTSRETAERSRIIRFIAGVQDVVRFYGTLPGNIRRDVFNGGYDGREGFTLSIWADDKSMIAAAYRDGVHKSRMDQHRNRSLFDRSSFTRARLVDCHGTWGGAEVALSD